MAQPAAVRRNRVGTRKEDLYKWQPQPFAEIDTLLAVQQYIQQTIRKDPSKVADILDMPDGVDVNVWQYEHMRQICLELNGLIVALADVCARDAPMKINTEQYLVPGRAGQAPRECSAIEYCAQTTDNANSALNSNDLFPSRLAVDQSSLRHIETHARRLYRIFAYAFFVQPKVFWEFETDTYLSERFTALCQKYKLVPHELMIIPNDAFRSK